MRGPRSVLMKKMTRTSTSGQYRMRRGSITASTGSEVLGAPNFCCTEHFRCFRCFGTAAPGTTRHHTGCV
ncbi:terpene synthase [Anopheles sinensis]|uniref:Terpene synthase n=1 Tax=Anopheles sinensis TaxID=74873 RepID=A0A084W357_ANOSI|nr:terpene synthase [Anopheles sinensis]